MTLRLSEFHKRIMTTRRLLLVGSVVGIAVINALIAPLRSSKAEEQTSVTWYDYEIINVYPHDPNAFTEGLLFREGFLFESTGLNGRSTLRKVRLETGEIVHQRKVDSAYFAEGLTDWGDSLVQLTWSSGTGFIYDLQTFALTRTVHYPGEGMGLTRYNDHLVMSDGTSVLHFLNAETLLETRRIKVTESGRPIVNLNELEVVQGKIFANVWQTDEIVIIDPESGAVTGRIDLRGLLTSADRVPAVDVLNGIAYDPESDRLFVTGKLWPRLFEIRLRPR
jgi:glutamine cyclotransferase